MTMLDNLSEDEIEQLYNAGLVSDSDVEQVALTRMSPHKLAMLDALAYGIAKLFNTPINQLAAEAAAHRARTANNVTSATACGNLPARGDRPMMTPHDYIGADGQSYPEIAARAVQSTQQQSPSPVYGYLRSSTQQKVYLFQALDDAQGWFTALAHGQAQPYDYAAVFAATNLTRPVPGFESFGHTFVSGDPEIGSWLPFLLGLPVGAAAGYFGPTLYEKASNAWATHEAAKRGVVLRDQNVPRPPSTTAGQWYDIEGPAYTIGSWVDLVGAQPVDGAQRRAHAQSRALIQSAINEVKQDAQFAPGVAAFVWSLDPPDAYASTDLSRPFELEGTTGIRTFNSVAEALDYMRQRIQTPHVALALFDRRSAHWPNPTNWTKSNDPTYESVIAQQIVKNAPTRTAGWVDLVGQSTSSALRNVRARAEALASAKPGGNAAGVIHSKIDGLWYTFSFASLDDAIDWLQRATHDRASFTYAAAYEKALDGRAYIQDEEIGGVRAVSKPGSLGPRGIATTSGAW